MTEKQKLSPRFWCALTLFSLIGQVAWVVENMYLNVFIYKMFAASAADISLMVAASAVTATLTTVLIGALSDKVGKRKLFICSGYILWGISIFCFALLRTDWLGSFFPMAVSAASLGVSLTIILDCVMTFFGSSANDAAFNAWLTDSTDATNRGAAEGINSMMPLVAILVVFGGFMAFDLEKSASWSTIFFIIGGIVLVIGVLGMFLIKDTPITKSEAGYFETLLYGFRRSTVAGHSALYLCLFAFILFNISIQIFMPYLIIYYEVSLGMVNYVFIMAPAIIISAVVTAFWGKVYDKKGFRTPVFIALGWLAAGYIILFFCRSTLLVFIGSLFMMCGYLSGMAVFGARIRDLTPSGKAGRLQGVRIFSQVLIPGIAGPYIGKSVLANAEMILNNDGTYSFVPNANIFLAALLAIVPVVLLLLLTKPRNVRTVRLTTPFEEMSEGGWGETYPRPQMKRDSFITLCGDWELAVKKNGFSSETMLGTIKVPFPPESELSGINRPLAEDEAYIYRRTFNVTEDMMHGHLLLHFGAVDQIARVYVNDMFVGEHVGGYLPFRFDITQHVTVGGNTMTVEVTDTLDLELPYGKQCKKRGGMWYTPISGIWQPVWLEHVPENYIQRLKLTPSLDSVVIETIGGAEEKVLVLQTESGEKEYRWSGDSFTLHMDAPHVWSPEDPYLYTFTLSAGEDKIESYFALRTVTIENVNSQAYICLNGKPYFFHGLLDQGYYSDGIYLPATPEGYRYDVLTMKELGFNMLRKHIKIEPDLFYYYCDKYGMIVFQDMVNSGKYHYVADTVLPTIGIKTLPDKRASKRRATQFESDSAETIQLLYNHPSVCYYTIFNEGWGQYDSDRIYGELKALDVTRVWDTTSGWFAENLSDVVSEHVYFRKLALKSNGQRPLVLSEFGGYSCKIEGHSFNLDKTYGYGKFTDTAKFSAALTGLYRDEVITCIGNGLNATVYTQVSDVEDETNGLVTYDRKVVKVDKDSMQALAKELREAFTEQVNGAK